MVTCERVQHNSGVHYYLGLRHPSKPLQCNVKDDMPRWMFLRGRVQGEVLQMSNFLLLLKSSLIQPTAESGFILDANRRIIMWHGRLSVISSEEEERDTRNSQ